MDAPIRSIVIDAGNNTNLRYEVFERLNWGAMDLNELFTVNQLGLTSALTRCLGTKNLIDNGHAAARERTRRVKNWHSGEMALRWTAASFEAASQGFRRSMG